MLFHSHEFLTLLAVTLAVFALAPVQRRPAVLLTASMIFYAYAGLAMLALFLAVSAFAYFCLRRIEAGRAAGASTKAGDRRWAVVGVTVILANLIFFKYSAFALETVAPFAAVGGAQDWISRTVILPVGISFYSFQLIAVLIDAQRGQRLNVRSFRELLLFIMFFGHLIAGPIMRGREFFPQLHVLPGPSIAQVRAGVLLLIAGLIKKVIFADELLAGRVDILFGAGADLSIGAAWLAGALFGFQIYFDFSGYVDMALGMSKLFGLELMPNFATPFISRTPSEFWSRWNITLSRWFGDYVYIPLGGSRGSLAATVRNLLITMVLSGLWHGAGWTFLIWGAIHGLYLAAYHAFRRIAPDAAASMASGRAQWLGWAVTFAVTTIAWVYFRAPNVNAANAIVANMWAISPGIVTVPSSWYLLAAALLVLHWFEAWWLGNLDSIATRLGERWARLPGPVQALSAFPILFVIVAITKVVRGAFIYFQF
jgi:alginate O-acetyltransferase complex protein AlgI